MVLLLLLISTIIIIYYTVLLPLFICFVERGIPSRSPYSRHEAQIVYDFSRKLDSDCSRHDPCLVDDLTVDQSTDVFGKERRKKTISLLFGTSTSSIDRLPLLGKYVGVLCVHFISGNTPSVRMRNATPRYPGMGGYALHSTLPDCSSVFVRVFLFWRNTL